MPTKAWMLLTLVVACDADLDRAYRGAASTDVIGDRPAASAAAGECGPSATQASLADTDNTSCMESLTGLRVSMDFLGALAPDEFHGSVAGPGGTRLIVHPDRGLIWVSADGMTWTILDDDRSSFGLEILEDERSWLLHGAQGDAWQITID